MLELILKIVVISTTIVLTILAGEVVSYLHHRFTSHKDWPGLGPVRATHRAHHQIWFKDKEDRAYEDFIWVALVLGLMWSSFFLVRGFIASNLLALVLVTSTLFSLYKAWIHGAYHTPGHFLLRYSWFRRWKRLHEIHHVNPKKNFSLSWFKVDQWLGTYQSEEATNC